MSAYVYQLRNFDYKKYCCLEFGSYFQKHESHDNSMLPRTIGAIGQRPTGNNQRGYITSALSQGKEFFARIRQALRIQMKLAVQMNDSNE